MLPKARASNDFSLTQTFIERSRITQQEPCQSCNIKSYTLSVFDFSKLEEKWEAVHATGCYAAQKGNDAISGGGKKPIKPEKRRHYLGSYLIKVEDVLKTNWVLSCSSISVKSAPSDGMDSHMNICLTFDSDATEDDIEDDVLSLSEALLQIAFESEAQEHICKYETEETEKELKRFKWFQLSDTRQ